MRSLFLGFGVAFLFGCSGLGCNGSSSTTATGGGTLLCIPGEQKACACPHGVQGAQVCLEDGSGYAADLSNAMQFCGSFAPALNALQSLFSSYFTPIIQAGVMQAIDGQVCLSP